MTVLVTESDETFEADPDTKAMLLKAIAQCARKETTRLAQLLEELRRDE